LSMELPESGVVTGNEVGKLVELLVG